MKKSFVLLALMFFGVFTAFSQTTEAEESVKKIKSDIPDGWGKGGLFSVSFTQVSLTNWAAGGQNSLSGAGMISLYSDYKKKTFIWNNSLDLGYGLMKQGEDNVFKTDDKLDFVSKAGRQASKNWFYTGLLSLKTQMTDGYNYPNDSVAISKFMAPGYILGALGMDYKPGEKLSVFIAPVTGKITVVNDDRLSALGAYGVKEGKKTLSEFGGYIRAAYKTDITNSIAFQTKADFFSNYLNKPQNIDVSWETLLLMKLGKLITVSFSTHLINDADIITMFKDDGEGVSKVQFKQILGLGLSYKI